MIKYLILLISQGKCVIIWNMSADLVSTKHIPEARTQARNGRNSQVNMVDARMKQALGSSEATATRLQNTMRSLTPYQGVPLAFTLKNLLESGFTEKQLTGLNQTKLKLLIAIRAKHPELPSSTILKSKKVESLQQLLDKEPATNGAVLAGNGKPSGNSEKKELLKLLNKYEPLKRLDLPKIGIAKLDEIYGKESVDIKALKADLSIIKAMQQTAGSERSIYREQKGLSAKFLSAFYPKDSSAIISGISDLGVSLSGSADREALILGNGAGAEANGGKSNYLTVRVNIKANDDDSGKRTDDEGYLLMGGSSPRRRVFHLMPDDVLSINK